jgi:uncharacterized lipoprotein YbaY
MVAQVAVRGTAELRPEAPLRNAVAYVRIRDVTLVDVAAPLIAEQVIGGLSSDRTGKLTFPFALAFPPAAGTIYGLEAHVSLSGRPDVERGDYLTMQAYPVPVDGNTATMRVKMTRVA